MILVNVVIAQRVNEVAHFEFGDVRDQVHQQRVRADVEWHAKEGIGGALVKLTVKNASALDLELKQRVTRRQGDLIARFRVPTGDDQAA